MSVCSVEKGELHSLQIYMKPHLKIDDKVRRFIKKNKYVNEIRFLMSFQIGPQAKRAKTFYTFEGLVTMYAHEVHL